jgi:hypothetical protein
MLKAEPLTSPPGYRPPLRGRLYSYSCLSLKMGMPAEKCRSAPQRRAITRGGRESEQEARMLKAEPFAAAHRIRDSMGRGKRFGL